MTTMMKPLEGRVKNYLFHKSAGDLVKNINASWDKIGPFWPLRNLAAVNPVSGFEELPFEEALKQAKVYFQQQDFPGGIEEVNRQSIKWLQSFFDEGESTISMPMRHLGLFNTCLRLIKIDSSLNITGREKKKWLMALSGQADEIISECLFLMSIPAEDCEQFMTLMLTTLPGWASYIKYRTDWADDQDIQNPCKVSKEGYLALRILLTYLIWPEAKELLAWHNKNRKNADVEKLCSSVRENESLYRAELFKSLREGVKAEQESSNADAQLVFCIDVRSEPFRRALEEQGNYETLGFAGFFGVPVSIEDEVSGSVHSSCPVLLKPAHKVLEQPSPVDNHAAKKGHKRTKTFKRIYQSVKYNFTTSFSLVETVGLWSGLVTGLRSMAPSAAAQISSKFKEVYQPEFDVNPNIDSISEEDQLRYASNALKLMGMTDNFAPLTVFCGHGSSTQNNAYETALDCGACGGRHGAPNARILASILNKEVIRKALAEKGISISPETWFLAAEHNTTTDEVLIYDEPLPDRFRLKLSRLKNDLQSARIKNCTWRSAAIGLDSPENAEEKILTRSQDWAEVRPEWGLAGNASFIVGDRSITKGLNLNGRSFLHSYNWQQDENGELLTAIMTAPMVVAQWINSQYFFSTLNNAAYGSGSKVTQNITGKIGVMQGNASDLMHGLPLQSVNKSDAENFHECLRLSVVIHAPKSRIRAIVSEQEILQKLFGNGWVLLTCFDPEDKHFYTLDRNLEWNRD